MYNQLEYIQGIIADVPGIDRVLQASNITEMEGLFVELRNLPECFAIVVETNYGKLDFNDRRLNTSYNDVYVFTRAKVNDNAGRLAAERNSMAQGIALFERMLRDKFPDWDGSTYGLDDSDINYQAFGPVNNHYGYSFSYRIDHEF